VTGPSRGLAALAALAFVPIAWFSFRDVGLVGETAITWALRRPPQVAVDLAPLRWADGLADPTAGGAAGPFVASQVRPIERLHVAGIDVPLLVNGHTTALPDWPDAIVYGATGSLPLVRLGHLLAGAAILFATARLAARVGSPRTAVLVAVLLATDWAFGFYKAALGGTELALQLAVLLGVGALVGERRTWTLPLTMALGLVAKLAFVPVACVVALVFFATGQRPARREWILGLAAVALAAVPYAIGALHHAAAVPSEPHVVSHDFPSVQWSRVGRWIGGGHGGARESLAAVGSFFGNPLAFFGPAYGAAAPSTFSPLRLVGWLFVLRGALGAGRPVRILGAFLVLSTVVLLAVAREMHHLAMLTPALALWAALSLDAFAKASNLRAAALVAPLVAANVGALAATSRVLATVRPPTFTATDQAALVALLRDGGVERLVVSDYASYGLLDVLAPEIEVQHAWGYTSWRGDTGLPNVLRLASGAHLLVVESEAPLRYDLHPSIGTLEEKARLAHVGVDRVNALPGDRAVLYRIVPR
jgi:hypothetical protein